MLGYKAEKMSFMLMMLIMLLILAKRKVKTSKYLTMNVSKCVGSGIHLLA